MEDQPRRERNLRAMESFMEAVGRADFERLESICTGDFVAELPYSEPPKCLEGFPAYRAAVEPMVEILRFHLDLVRVHPGLDPDLIVAEYTSEGTAVPTGKPYRNVYVGIFHFREGRICGLREFFNPLRATESLSPD